MSAVVTVGHRMAAYTLEHSLPLGSFSRRCIHIARYWEGFQESYTPEQVSAAQDFLVAISDGDAIDFSRTANAVKALNPDHQ